MSTLSLHLFWWLCSLYDYEVAPANQAPWSVKPAAGVGAEYGVVPLLPIPGDGAIDVDIQPTLRWTRHPEAVSYKVYAGGWDDPDFRENTTERSFSLPRLESGAHFYWRVEAVLADSSKVTGPLWRFRVRAPFATGPQPRDQMTEVPLEGTLSWRPGVEAKAQKLHFGMSNPPPLVATQNETQFSHGELMSGTTYHWRVDQVVGDQTIAGKIWPTRTTFASTHSHPSTSPKTPRFRLSAAGAGASWPASTISKPRCRNKGTNPFHVN